MDPWSEYLFTGWKLSFKSSRSIDFGLSHIFVNLLVGTSIMTFCLLFIAIFFSQEVPLKPKEQFELKLDYQFKPRPLNDGNTVQLGAVPSRDGAGVLPYLILNIKLLELQGEKMRVQISTNLDQRPSYRKVALNTLIELDLGFTDDMVDRVSPHRYVLTFIDSEKKPVDRILISVEDDGSFLVNGEKRGKF
jgi:hypothetical protein